MADTCQRACSLSPTGLSARKAAVAELLHRHPPASTPIPGGRRLTFGPGPQIEQELRRLIALEADCCAFLTMTLTAADGTVSLTVTGPPEAQVQLADIFTPFS
jgi:hypothetical protein